MKYCLCIACVLLVSLFTTKAQTVKDIDLAFAQSKYEIVLRDARTLIAKEPQNAYCYGIIGAVYVRESKYDSSIYYLQQAIKIDNDSNTISGWAHVNLGTAYLYLGDKTKAIAELTRGIDLDFPNNSVKTAKRTLDSIGYKLPEKEYPKNYLPNWVVIEGKNIIYKFQDTAGKSSQFYKFIQKHEEAYLQLSKIFDPKLPMKMTIHVWNDREIAQKILHTSLGFSTPKQCFSHLYKNQTIGHELAHVLSYWAWGIESNDRNRFISEGIAVCFDLEHNDKYAFARRVVAKENIHNVLELWEKEKKYDEGVLYPIAGAFVTYLYTNSTPEQFQFIIKRQSPDNAKIIYGAQFDKLIKDFNELMGMK